MKTKASILLLSTSKLLNFQGLLGYPLNIKTSADNRFLFIMASKQGYKRESAKKDERCSYLDMIRCNGNQHPLFHYLTYTWHKH
ncbi:hypothetical protein DL98DRAFT_519923 [Cadophora sp. DSE1049]|nr:hypothetical protein DL98DRAFT_519923 [Cadophora sp. DSE1049]